MNLLLGFGLPSTPDLIVIVVLVVLLFGAKKLPELARGLGQSLGEFKKARDDFEREVHKSTVQPPPPQPPTQLAAPSSIPPITPVPESSDQFPPVQPDPPKQA